MELQNGHSLDGDRALVDDLMRFCDQGMEGQVALREKLLELVTQVRTLKERVAELELEGNEKFCIETCPMDADDQAEQSFSIDYSPNTSEVLTGDKAEEDIPKNKVPGNKCWNCDSEGHSIRECKEKRNQSRINANRQVHSQKNARLSNTRYHVDEPQRFGHLRPGLPSKKLRAALGLRDDQLPSYIYEMRRLGYPPGWLKEAEINHSNVSVYVEQDKSLPDHGDEDGEISADKTQYDTDKLVDWPGFNVDCDFEHVFTDESNAYRAGPMRPEQSKESLMSNMAHKTQQGYVRGEMQNTSTKNSKETTEEKTEKKPEEFKTPVKTSTAVKQIDDGTPIVQMHSPFNSLPAQDKWTTNTTDHVFFENLPDATGKYDQMVEILKKVRSNKKNLNND